MPHKSEFAIRPPPFRCNKYVQVEYHQMNWADLPEKFERRIDAIFDGIGLPLPSEELTATFRRMKNEWKRELHEAAQEHMCDRWRATVEKLRASRPALLDKAIPVAKNRLQNHYKGKMETEDLEHRLDSASNLVKFAQEVRDKNQSDMSGTAITETETMEETSEWNQVTKGARKRGPVDNSPVTTSNNFSALENIEESDEVDIITTRTRSENSTRRAPKKSKTSEDDVRDVPEIINQSLSHRSTGGNNVRDIKRNQSSNQQSTSGNNVRDVKSKQPSNQHSASVDNVRDVKKDRSIIQCVTTGDDVRDALQIIIESCDQHLSSEDDVEDDVVDDVRDVDPPAAFSDDENVDQVVNEPYKDMPAKTLHLRQHAINKFFSPVGSDQDASSVNDVRDVIGTINQSYNQQLASGDNIWDV